MDDIMNDKGPSVVNNPIPTAWAELGEQLR